VDLRCGTTTGGGAGIRAPAQVGRFRPPLGRYLPTLLAKTSAPTRNAVRLT